MPSDFTAINSTLPVCAMIPSQQNFTRHDERFSPTAKIGQQFPLLSRAIKHSDIHLEVLFLQSRKFFEYFFCFHRTLGISPKGVASLLAGDFHKFELLFDFLARNFIGSCVIRCAFWLVSRKDDCLERELRKSFWIKKLINKNSLHLSNWFWEIFYKSNRKLFSVFAEPDIDTRGVRRILDSYASPRLRDGFA